MQTIAWTSVNQTRRQGRGAMDKFFRSGKTLPLSILTLLTLILGGCTKEAPPPAFPPATVLVAKAVKKEMPLAIAAIGTVEAYRSINVYSRVTGQLLRTHFREGEDVRAGQILFTIDPAPFREKLHQAEARLAKSNAQAQFNEAEAKRYAFLLEKGAVSKSEADRYLTDAAAYAATVKADQAEVEDARLNLAYCSVRAPFAGRTGVYGVNLGTVVRANETSLTTLNQLVPVYVRFSVPEKYLAQIRKYLAAGTVSVMIVPEKNITVAVPPGKLVFVDNAIDAATGMIRLKAEFPNHNKALWPGQFVGVSLRLTTQPDVVVAPLRAVQTGDQGQFVFVVKPDLTAAVVPVLLDRTQGEEAVIVKGLQGGETVITDGHLKVRPGGKVEIRETLGAEPGRNENKGSAGGQGR